MSLAVGLSNLEECGVIHHERRGAVALVTIDRPDRRNAVDVEALAGLLDAVRTARTDGTRVLVLTGAGGHFCAGADLTGLEDSSFADTLRAVLDAVRLLPLATIAAVEGAAMGAGTQLAVACDLRVATADARFAIPAARLGLMVDQWTVQRVSSLLGQGTARAVLLAAEVVSGLDAHRLGFVQRLGGIDDALGWAAEIADLAPLTIAGHKVALEHTEPEIGVHPDVQAAFAAAWSSDDLVEGRAAFRERRRPRFQGR